MPTLNEENRTPISEISEPVEEEREERESLEIPQVDSERTEGEETPSEVEETPQESEQEESSLTEGEEQAPSLLGAIRAGSDDRIPISEMSALIQMNNDDLVVTVQNVNGVLTTFKAPLTLLGSHLLKVMQFASDLDTANKTIISAINELVGGAGVSSLSALTDVTIVSPSNGQVLTYNATSGKWVNGAGAELALTSEVIGSICSFNNGSDGQPVKSWKTTITPIQAGSGTPAPDNIRALSARTQVVASQGGANQYDYTTDTDNRYFSSAGGTASSTSWRCSDYIEVTPSSKVIATGLDNGSASGSHFLCVYKQDKSFSRSIQIYANTDVVVNVASDEYYIRTSVRKASNEYLMAKVFEVVSEKTISFGTSVFGGEANINAGGVNSNIQVVTFDGSEDWATNGTSGVWLSVSGLGYLEVAYCNMFEPLANGTSNSMGNNQIRLNTAGTNLLVKCPDAMTGDAFKALLQTNNLQVGFRVIPTAIVTQGEAFNTAAGENQFYTDCGVSDVVYFNSMVDDVVDICDEVIASKTKILTGTLSAGSTTITFTDSALTSDCTKDLYVDDAFFGVAPTAMVADYVNHSVTYTFPAQASNMPVKLEVR